MRVGVLVNGINVVLNFLLIYPTRETVLFSHLITIPGAGLGVIGAAIASAIAFTVGGICITIVLWRHPLVSPRGQKLRPDWAILKPCLRVALPNMLQRFGTSLGYVAFASMINSIGEVATAAHTIANTVESAFYIPGYGMQTAAATLAGNAYGANDNKKGDNGQNGFADAGGLSGGKALRCSFFLRFAQIFFFAELDFFDFLMALGDQGFTVFPAQDRLQQGDLLFQFIGILIGFGSVGFDGSFGSVIYRVVVVSFCLFIAFFV